MMTKDWVSVGELATARSGDKGNHANVAVVAYDQTAYDLLRELLTVERVREFLRSWCPTVIERFEVPGLQSLNFLLYNVLDGGASLSLRLDTQGKLLGTVILECPLPLDPLQAARLRASGRVVAESESLPGDS